MTSPPTMPSAPPDSRRLRWSLLCAGAIETVGLFAYTGTAVHEKTAGWPWQHFQDEGTASRRADIVLWTITCALALAAGAGVLGRRLLPLLGGALIVLILRCYGDVGAFSARPPLQVTMSWLLAAAALGAGSTLLAFGDEHRRGAGRALVLAGSLGVLVSFVTVYDKGAVGGVPFAVDLRKGFTTAWQDLISGAERNPDRLDALWDNWWGKLVPMALTLVAAAAGLFLAGFDRAGRAWRILARGVLACLVVRWLAPMAHEAWTHRRHLLAAEGREMLARGIVDVGFALWLLATATLLAATRDEAADPAGAAAGTAS